VGATLWMVLTVAGFGLLRAMDYTTHPLLDALLVRAAAFSFVGAGLIGASGWLGTTIAATVSWANGVGASVGSAAFGTGAVWIAWLVMAVAWVLTILPETWFDAPIPDWLSVAGLVLPALAASIPGPLGQGLRSAISAAGHVMITGASRAVGL